MFLKRFISIVFIFYCLNCSADNLPFMVGTGIYDITGPAAEIDMMGYAKPQQLDNGLHSRLWARAFIIADPKTEKSIVFVSADLGMVFQSVKQGVVQALSQKFGQRYNDKNIMLSATHTHAGPGGYAFHTLFNFTIRGFYRDNYNTIVNGIVQAIERAHNNLEPGNILIKEDLLTGTSINRSKAAYQENPVQEREQYDFDTDKSFVLIKLLGKNNQPIGLINWHAVHGVSMSNENTLISGDNKGYAAYLFEKDMDSNYLAEKTFVAAFAQANEGDASPNITGYHPDGLCDQINCLDAKHTFSIGKLQYQKAKQLFETTKTNIGQGVDFRHQYIDMSNTEVQSQFADGKIQKTCPAALGYAFGAGTSDGPGMDKIFHQGQVKGDALVNLLRNIIASPTKEMEQCQAPKPILLAVGLNKPAWVPHNMPVQIFKIGRLIIAGVPGEFTTMAGRRVKALLKEKFADSVDHVVVAGLSNSYAGYVTTHEEYLHQNYEGGFTVFGPWTLGAYLQSFDRLALDMLSNKETPTGPIPEDLHTNTGSLISPVLFDDKLITKSFGSVHQQPEKTYQIGDVVHASFWAGHPRNNFETMRGFLEIQYLNNNQWQTIAHDWDFNTVYHWERIGIAYAYGHIYWKIDKDTKPGLYRIKHLGHYKYGWNQKIYPYEGTTRTFIVNNN